MKILINTCFGGFGLSEIALKEYRKLKGIQESDSYNIDRSDPILIQVVETLGRKVCADRFASLAIVEIPDNVEWEISEYDGMEQVDEKHRHWREDCGSGVKDEVDADSIRIIGDNGKFTPEYIELTERMTKGLIDKYGSESYSLFL